MKILMATMGLDIGGAETHIVELARKLRSMGHDITVASNGGVYVEELESAGVRHVKIPMHKRSLFLMAKSFFMLRRLIRDYAPDVVHAHARIPAFLCGLLQKSMGFPFVTTAHWVFDTGGLLGVLTNWGDRTIAVSEDVKKYLIDNYGLSEENISVTVNGIDTERFSPEVSGAELLKELNIPFGTPVVAHVSRLDEGRELAALSLIRTAPTLASRVPGVVIIIAGGGDKFTELKRLSEEMNLRIGYRCLCLIGPRTDVNAVCAAGDVFVGVSRAALEAMAVGRPTVVAGNEGYMGLFDEDKLEAGIAGNFCCRGCPELTDPALLDDVTSALALPAEDYERLSVFSRDTVLRYYSLDRMAGDALAAYSAAAAAPFRVVLSGYYGFGNAGDEAILYALCRSVRDTRPTAQITVLSNDPKGTARIHGCAAVSRFDPFKVWRAVKRCDLLISGGGSLLQDATSTRSILYYLAVIRLAQKLGKKTMLYANGIGPVTREANRRRVRKCVELADAVTLRDPDSLRELREMGVERDDLYVTADPVFLLPEPDRRRTDEILREVGVTGRYIAVSLRPFDLPDEFYEKFAKICDAVASRYELSVVFVAMQPRRDEPVCWDVQEHMTSPSFIVSGDYSPEELMGVIGYARLVLSMRLHALIFAARMATPALGFVYDPKVESYLAMLRQPSAGHPERLDVDSVVAAANMIIDRREDIADKLRDTLREVTDAANINADILDTLLS